MFLKVIYLHSEHPLYPERLSPSFQKSGPDRISIFRGKLLEKWGEIFEQGGRRDRSCYIKNKPKSEILHKKHYKRKCLSAITKSLNWKVLTKNLVTFTRYSQTWV